MRIQQSSQQGCVVLTLAGRIDLAAAPELQRAILKQLAEHPPAIICDLGEVEAIDPLCAGVFTSIRHPVLVRASRAFVREVCDLWGLQELAEPAALLASELVTNAVVHARTAMELRVKLRGPRLHVDVRDQDSNLVRVLAAKEGTGRGRGLTIVDRVASAWGVRQRRAGGKTVWCTLDLPPQHAAMTGRGPQLSASTRTAAADREDHHAADAIGAPGRDLVWGKLATPVLRAGLIPRASLQSLLQTGVQAKLCLLSAPAGSGKTTLLGQWHAAAGGERVAWLSVDEGDNDPTRFWLYVVAALQTVEPTLGTAALEALRGPNVDLDRVVLPSLLGELAAMRARGELAELRAADLQVTGEEASELLNGAMGLRLGAEDVARLVERTEGWAAGLGLAGVALRGRQDPSTFIALFHGDDRHVAGYLVTEMLQRLPEAVRAFLLETSVVARLSGPLCDAVLETEGSDELLDQLERSNLLLVPLDDRREGYRFQQPFGELLRLELSYRKPALVPVLHRRAAAWHRQAGNLEEASYHATAAERSPKPTP